MTGHVPRYLAAIALALQPIAIALPDTAPASPRSIVTAVSVGMLAAAVYLGAEKPVAGA